MSAAEPKPFWEPTPEAARTFAESLTRDEHEALERIAQRALDQATDELTLDTIRAEADHPNQVTGPEITVGAYLFRLGYAGRLVDSYIHTLLS